MVLQLVYNGNEHSITESDEYCIPGDWILQLLPVLTALLISLWPQKSEKMHFQEVFMMNLLDVDGVKWVNALPRKNGIEMEVLILVHDQGI